MKISQLFAVLAASVVILTGCGQTTKVIAHRGYWRAEGSAQNSIAALSKAAEIGVYGCEFDVQMTCDRKLVVYHDDVLNGLRIADTPFAELKDFKLPNGERLPTLKAYLEAALKYPDLKLVLEIKTHPSKEHERAVVDRVLQMVHALNLHKRVDYISFSLDVCQELAAREPQASVAYLRGDQSPSELKKMGINGLDYFYDVLLIHHPDWIDQARESQVTVNAWTVNQADIYQKLVEKKVDFITTDYPVEMKAFLDVQ